MIVDSRAGRSDRSDGSDGSNGRLADNIVHFARILRAAGLPVGPGRALDAVRAVAAAGVSRRDDFYWALHAVLVNKRDQHELFDQTFEVFWKNPDIFERTMSLVTPRVKAGDEREKNRALRQRVADALNRDQPERALAREREPDSLAFDAALTWSATEVLGEKDFETMTADEFAAAADAVSAFGAELARIPTRRFRPGSSADRVDMRKTMRTALRYGADIISLARRRKRTRVPPLVILCDVSGSMERYARMLLHFLHALANGHDRVHAFLFGTRLSNITKALGGRDVDTAIENVAAAVRDWGGGTRIGHCVGAFNKSWSRRVPTQDAVVLFISDGLDRDAGDGLGREMERLHLSCRRLIWLNPLLRYARFEPKALGVRAILPHVDEFRPVHNLNILKELGRALGGARPGDRLGGSRWKGKAA
ncbi:MAG: VWA domain-containing protein [Rhodospirillales bacterium]|jgi:hypothetical protein|nr:VWA domain-containing protein [Rhodospirillales bacterium]